MAEKMMSRREAAKADRRRRIVQAARDLIKETGQTGLSMRAIAARADVSLATPYNLFGSKRAIIMALLDDVQEFEERFNEIADADPIDKIFAALKLSLGYHEKDPDFYRVVWSTLLDPQGSAEQRDELMPPQNHAFWRGLLEEFKARDLLDERINLECLQHELGHTFAAVMLTWLMGGRETSDLMPSICYGFALSLLGASTEAARPSLMVKLLEFQNQKQTLET